MSLVSVAEGASFLSSGTDNLLVSLKESVLESSKSFASFPSRLISIWIGNFDWTYYLTFVGNVLSTTCSSDSFSTNVFLNFELIAFTSFIFDSSSETLESLLVFDIGLNVGLNRLSTDPAGFFLSSYIFGTNTSHRVTVVQNITNAPDKIQRN